MLAFSSQARSSISEELLKFPKVETGGILLGYFSGEKIEIIESVSGGKKAKRGIGYFEYDVEYLEKKSFEIANHYSPSLAIVGVWHKHNHDLEPAFSEMDVEAHKEFSKVYPNSISLLFQKCADRKFKTQYIQENSFVKDEGVWHL